MKRKPKFIGTWLSMLCLLIFATPKSFGADEKNNVTTRNTMVSLPGKASVVDLTQLISPVAPRYGGKAGEFKYEVLTTVTKEGYGSGAFCMHEHLGTHIDAPVHFCNGGLSVDKINAFNLILPLSVIDVREEVRKNPDYLLTVDKIKELERRSIIDDNAAILLLTGWDKGYFIAGQYRNADNKGIMHFPGFSEESAKYLIEHHKARALGIDTLSIDYGPSENFLVHKFALQNGLFLIENLTNLDKLPKRGAVGIFAPLKLEGGTGSPTRVFGLLP